MDQQARNDLAAAMAAMDQLRAVSRDIAALIGGYFKELLDQGMERGEALLLTQNYQAQLVPSLFRAGQPPEDEQ